MRVTLNDFDGTGARKLTQAGQLPLPTRPRGEVSEAFTGDDGAISAVRSPFFNYTSRAAITPTPAEVTSDASELASPTVIEATPPVLEKPADSTADAKLSTPEAPNKPVDKLLKSGGGDPPGGPPEHHAPALLATATPQRNSTATTLAILGLAAAGSITLSVLSHFTELFGNFRKTLALLSDGLTAIIATFGVAVLFGGNYSTGSDRDYTTS